MSAPMDVSFLSFCFSRVNVCFLREHIEGQSKNSLCKEVRKVERFICQGNYIPAVELIWNERNLGKKLEWLRSKEPELHPPLLLELALAECEQTPTLETVTQRTLPLIYAGIFRIAQDCYSVDAEKLMFARVFEIYRRSLHSLLKDKGIELEWGARYVHEHESEVLGFIEAKVLEVSVRSLQGSFAPPEWVINAKQCSLLTTKKNLYPEKETKRVMFVAEFGFFKDFCKNSLSLIFKQVPV